jgi:hypothetical protein
MDGQYRKDIYPGLEVATIYIMAMTSDAAVQNTNMYFGLSLVYDFDRFQEGTIAAHELHHVLRKEREFGNHLTKIDTASIALVQQVNNEGCADNKAAKKDNRKPPLFSARTIAYLQQLEKKLI